ncbi:MAG: lipoate--protein ligase family protein [Paludibacteraceae bacterium]|nr:lipoate--protein ligase family protein [Paludibacteraceae bacterium]
MKILNFPNGLSLAEYLQIEQDLVREVEEPVLFTWVVRPTVIYGRHQSEEAEVNLPYCRQHGIAIVQRKSGGGCVYADEGNLMLSFVTPDTHSEQVFRRFLSTLAEALQRNGLQAVTTAHNDVLIDGRKVSGCACYTTPTGTIVHGTLLYDVNLDHMMAAITPTGDKLSKHGVASVRQRVANLRELTDRFKDIQALRNEIETYYATK